MADLTAPACPRCGTHGWTVVRKGRCSPCLLADYAGPITPMTGADIGNALARARVRPSASPPLDSDGDRDASPPEHNEAPRRQKSGVVFTGAGGRQRGEADGRTTEDAR